MNDDDITPIGRLWFRRRTETFAIKRKDRRLGMALLGKTGMGKSTLAESLMKSDARNGEGFGLLDPHGQLAEAILTQIPVERRKDIIYFDPANPQHRLAFNVLDVRGVDPALAVEGIISVFKKLWDKSSWGNRTEHVLRNCLWTLIRRDGSTLADITRLLTDDPFRKAVVAGTPDGDVKNYWLKEYDKYSMPFRQVVIAPVVNKLSQFLLNPTIKECVVREKSELNAREIMDDGRILIANLSLGRLGESASALFGSMLLTHFELAALARADMPEKDRRDFYLCIDEFPTIATESSASILPVARKYRLCLIMVMQFVTQIETYLRDSIFENVGTIIAFNVGADSAARLSKEFRGQFESVQFMTLPPFHFYIRLAIDGRAAKAFSAQSPPRGHQAS